MSLFNSLWVHKNTEYLYTTKVMAVLLRDVDAVERVIPKGTKVRIWMVSRFGDAGITDNLSDECYGYCARVCNPRNPGTLEDYLGEVEGL